MIIEARSPEGVKTKIYDKDGVRIELPIKEYNTETQEAVVYEYDEKGLLKTTEWVQDGEGMRRQIITKTIKLEGSYAEIDGKRV